MTTNNDQTPLEERLTEAGQMVPMTDQAVADITGILASWYAQAQDSDDAPLQAALITLMSRTEQIQAYVYEQAILLNSVIVAMHTIKRQRDEALDEVEALETGLDNIWMTDHPRLRLLFDHLTDSYNEAFWESLPYDMANMLGGDWQHWDADTLYTALTVDLDEVDEDGDFYGFSRAQLVTFRNHLHRQVMALYRGEYDVVE